MAKNLVQDLLKIFKKSVSAALPKHLIQKYINFNPTTQQLTIANIKYNLQNKDVYIVGAGKAVQYMANEIETLLQSKIKEGILSVPIGSTKTESTNSNILYIEGAENNLPDKKAEATARKIKKMVSKLTKDDFLIILISGGGSALLPLPKEPITLEEKTTLIKNLANFGADITELNTVRKRISLVKGGQLAIDAQPAQLVTLILSDVVGDPLDIIASGPTVPNEDNPEAAINIIKKYNLYNSIPNSIKNILEENFVKNIKSFPTDTVQNIILGSNKLSVAAAMSEAEHLNYYPILLSHTVVGNVSDIVDVYTKLVKIMCNFRNANIDKKQFKNELQALNIPGSNFSFADKDEEISLIKTKDLCLILGGETTVKVSGSGQGGRNQQLTLEFSKSISSINEFKDHNIYFLSAGTDGIDGPTDAAGAIGYRDLISESKQANIDVNTYINNNDSYNFFRMYKNGALHVITGHTNTNVMDIHLIIIKKL